MSEFRQGGAEIATYIERVGDPGAVANRGRVYCKDVAAVTNLFFQDSAGTVFNIGGPASIDTLNESYNGPAGGGAGRTITADAGAVVINGAADANNVLELTTNVGGTGNALAITHPGAADAINISLSSSLTAQALVVTESAAVRTTPMVNLTRNSTATGTVLNITNSGSSNSIAINHASIGGDAINVQLTGASLTGQAVVVTEDAVARTLPMMQFTRDAAAVGDVIQITNAGSGFSLDVVSGNVRIASGTALGVGGAATLGLVGAAGPAATAQNEWLRLDSQNGTRFVALWA